MKLETIGQYHVGTSGRYRVSDNFDGAEGISVGSITETGHENYADEVEYQGTQGAASDGTTAWITAGADQHIWEIDLSTWNLVDSNVDFFTDAGAPNDYLQTAHYCDGTIYGFTRNNSIHAIDPDTLDHTGTYWKPVVPEHQVNPDLEYWEGITRYDGMAFSEPKWFLNDKTTDGTGDIALYRLKGPSDNFAYEKKYILNDTNPELNDYENIYDGITVFDHEGETYLAGSITSHAPDHPGIHVFVYDELGDSWYLAGTAVVDDDKYHTADEGFQMVSLDRVYAGLRFPHGSSADSDREVALSEQDWTDIIAQS